MAPPNDEPTQGRILHALHLQGDPVARNEIFSRYCLWLEDEMLAMCRRQQLFVRDGDVEAMARDAVLDALESYFKRPEQYNPDLRSLAGYLKMSAEGDFKNRFQPAVERTNRAGLQIVRIDEKPRNRELSDRGAAIAETEDAYLAAELTSWAADVAETDEERTVLGLMLDGVRDTESYATALGLAGLSLREQETRVTRIKERLMKRLRRRPGGRPDG